MSGAERGSSSAMRMRVDWRTLGEWVRQPAPAQAGPGILSTLLLILCATYQGGMIGSAVLTGRVGDGDLVAGIAPTRIGFAILIVAVMGSTALLTARRRYALAVFLAECAVYVVASALGLNNFFLFPVLVALGSAVSRLPLWQHLAAIGAAFLMATASAVLVAPPEVLMEEWLSQVVAVLLTVIAAMMARSVANWRAAQAGARAARERFRALRAERDRAVNRADIAAELHDSVGHDLTAIISLTEGLAGTVGDPDVDEAIGTINALAREGLADTRHAVDALSPFPSAAGDAVGPRGWDRLGEPLTTVRATGLSAALTETGRRPEDPRVGALVYTVVREALTNIMRHAAGAIRAVVALDHADGATRITVSDDGHAQGAPSAQEDGAPQPGPPERPLAAPSSGHGLIHLAEALHEAGGTLSAGPVPGGWRLHAVVPHRAGA